MYASVRQYRQDAGSIDALARRVEGEFAPALAQEPGFVSYQAIDCGDGTIVTISVFRDRAGAEESNELAAQWVAESLEEYALTRVAVMNGEVLVGRTNSEPLAPAER